MDQVKEFLSQFSGPQAYAVFYFVLIGCGIGMPINSDLVLISASVLAALGFFKLKIHLAEFRRIFFEFYYFA